MAERILHILAREGRPSGCYSGYIKVSQGCLNRLDNMKMNALKLWWKQYISSETMAVSLVLWLCSLVAIGLIVTPWFGPQVARLVALGLLLLALAVCWGICILQLLRRSSNS